MAKTRVLKSLSSIWCLNVSGKNLDTSTNTAYITFGQRHFGLSDVEANLHELMASCCIMQTKLTGLGPTVHLSLHKLAATDLHPFGP